jgi:hypothetical protein
MNSHTSLHSDKKAPTNKQQQQQAQQPTMPPRGRYNGRRGTGRVSEDALAAGLLARRLLLEPGNPYKFKTVDPDDRTAPVFGPRQSVIDEGKQDRMYGKFMTHSVDMGRFCTLVSRIWYYVVRQG